MFGVVPKTLWERMAPPDDRNRIRLAMRPLLVARRADDADRRRARRQGGREARRHLRPRSAHGTSITRWPTRARAGRHRHRARHAPALRSCRRLHGRDADGRARAALPARAVRRAARRVGRRDAPARAEPGELPAGELRAAGGGRRAWTSSTSDATSCRASACGGPAATRCTTRSC